MRITENVYSLDCTSGNFAYVILKPQVILIDSGRPGQGKAILDELSRMGVNSEDIRHILLTHHDVDHTGNAAFLQQVSGADVWISEADLPFLRREKSPNGIKWLVSKIMKSQIPEKINTYPENNEVEGIKIIPTPGHTPGHICLLYQDVLFAGDLVMRFPNKLIRSHPVMTWNQNILHDSIREVDHLPFRWICPAHGDPLERGNDWDQLI